MHSYTRLRVQAHYIPSLREKNTMDCNNGVMSCLQDMEFGRDRCESVFRNPICNASLAFADGQEARLVTSRDGRSVNNHLLIFIIKRVVNTTTNNDDDNQLYLLRVPQNGSE